MTYFRDNIEQMQGYTPGEQPKIANLIKLNTNENPFPPSPEIEKLLKALDFTRLRLYPDPMSDSLRDCIARKYGFKRDEVLAGNGSDDILTIAIRSFVGENQRIVCFEPTYSLYPVLAQIQNAKTLNVRLASDFSIPEAFFDSDLKSISADDNNRIFFVARPNAPTGRSAPKDDIVRICETFKGIVLIDEAYADFSKDNCLDLAGRFPNVIIARTLSKSYSLAGARIGFAIARKELIDGMNKVKDSYNTSFLSQQIAIAALEDDKYFNLCINEIIRARDYLSESLSSLGFTVIPSQSNFVFASPPEGKARELFDFLRAGNILVRYFPGEITGRFVRITVGKIEHMQLLASRCKEFISKK